MADNLPPGAEAEPVEDQADVVALWFSEIDRGQKAMTDWTSDASKIEERYRAEKAGARKGSYNVLWSNVQTMAPALYHKSPKCIVQRRFMDRDPIGRVACRILERAVQYQVDTGELHKAVRRAVKDRLLSGRGAVWLRYEPVIEAVDENERIKTEIVHVDYVDRADFVHEPARTWDEVSWIAKRAFMTRDELVKAFPETGKLIPLTQSPDLQTDSAKRVAGDALNKAEVWEIWNKAKGKVLFVAKDFEQIVAEKDDPYRLPDFFPCPAPLYATMTNDTMVPVPDYHQYEPQAAEMDDLTARIKNIVKAIRVKGAYALDFAELASIMDGAGENKLYPVQNWAQFSQAGGFKGAVDFMDIEPFVKALTELTTARDAVKAQIYEITGLSDVLRGQGDPNETATGVREKGRFATLRLQDQQTEVAVFVRDIVRIMADITAMLFQPDTLAEMASAEEMDELQIEVPMMPPPGPAMGAPLPPQRMAVMA